MLRKFSKSLLLSTLILGSLLSSAQATQATTPNAANGQTANAPRLEMGYLGTITKYDSKDKGALVKIVKVNPASRGNPVFLNTIVYLAKSRIDLMKEKEIKLGDYIEFQIITKDQLLPNPYAPLATPKQGSGAASQISQSIAQGDTTTPNNQTQTSTGQINNQGGQMNASGTQTATGQTPPPLEFTINGDPKLGNQMIISVPKIIKGGETLMKMPN